jgi:hypothetical protein
MPRDDDDTVGGDAHALGAADALADAGALINVLRDDDDCYSQLDRNGDDVVSIREV